MFPPSVEERSRRVRVEPPGQVSSPLWSEMAPPVGEHVAKGVAHLARTPEHPSVVAVCEEPPAPLEEGIEPAGEPDAEALESPGQHLGVRSLDQEVEVIVLDAVVDEAKALIEPPSDESTIDGLEGALLPQGGQAALEPQGDVNGLVATELRARPMGDARPRNPWASRAWSTAAMGAEGEGELRVGHLGRSEAPASPAAWGGWFA